MSKRVLPDPLERRHLLERELDPSRAGVIAQAYLDEGRVAEAVAFLRRAGERERLESLRRQAVEEGDLFLLREVAVALEAPPRSDEWAMLAESARRLGKERYAIQAARQAERKEVGDGGPLRGRAGAGEGSGGGDQ